MQLRGMAHIQSCLWLDELYLQNSSLFSEAQLMTRLIDNFIACEVPSEADPSRQFCREVQTYHPRKSCIKKSSTCRLGFPKLPSKLTLIAQQPELEDKKSVEPCQLILHKAKILLEKLVYPQLFKNSIKNSAFLVTRSITRSPYPPEGKLSSWNVI